MATVLDAGHVHSSDDGEVVLVGFADRQHGTDHYVLLQRTRDATDQDRNLGLDGVHITVDDESRSMYGGIRQVALERGCVRIHLAPEGVRKLQTDDEIVIRFEATEAEREELLARLKDLLGRQLLTDRGESW